MELALSTGVTVDPDPGERGELLVYAHIGQRTVALTLNLN